MTSKRFWVPTPECDRMLAAQDKSQVIGAFLDWAFSEQGWTLCEVLDHADHPFQPIRLSIERILAEYFEIDLQKVDEEKCALLEALRQKGRSSRGSIAYALPTEPVAEDDWDASKDEASTDA